MCAISVAFVLSSPSVATAATTTCASGSCTITFSATGSPQSWTVPSGVISVTTTVAGGSGSNETSNGNTSSPGVGGAGGAVHAAVPVTPGTILTVVVGQAGANGIQDSATPAPGGYGGGGNGGSMVNATHSSGGAGGGGSFLFDTTGLVIAAGGGGGGTSFINGTVNGGDGGSTGNGSPVAPPPVGSVFNPIANGQPGTQAGPGLGGQNDFNGLSGGATPATSPTALGTGGAGAVNPGGDNFGTAGGGGGGYYGAGGGGSDGHGGFTGAGAGGSGYVRLAITGTTGSTHTGNGVVTVSYAQVLTATTTTLTSGTRATAGTPTTLTAKVVPSAGSTGTVTFFDGTTNLGTAAVTNGTATLSVSLRAGTHALTAVYSGDGTLNEASRVTKRPHDPADEVLKTTRTTATWKRCVASAPVSLHLRSIRLSRLTPRHDNHGESQCDFDDVEKNIEEPCPGHSDSNDHGVYDAENNVDPSIDASGHRER